MNYPDRAPGVHLVTDYPPKATQDVLALRALRDLEAEREVHLDIVEQLSQAIRNIKKGLA